MMNQQTAVDQWPKLRDIIEFYGFVEKPSGKYSFLALLTLHRFLSGPKFRRMMAKPVIRRKNHE